MDQEHTLTFGSFRLETTSGRLTHHDDIIPLRPRSMAMLQYLAEHPGRLVTKAELLQQVWSGSHVSDDVLRASVRDIRRALGDNAEAPQYLETVGRQGYRFLQGGDALLRQAAGPVVGRQGEVDQLQARFARAAGGERQFVLLSGEPGIGKTTVVKLFLERMAEREGVRVAQGQCLVHFGDGEAYQPLLEALGRLGQGPGASEVLSVLQRYAPMWLVQLPALVSGVELERLQRLVQGASQARMVRELSEALEVLTAETPLILVLEDLHWSDVSTVELLAALAQRSAPARLFVLGTYRPADAAVRAQALRDVIQELRGRGQCDELAMELLSPEAVAAYVTGRLGGVVPNMLTTLIYEHAEGNPLFMVNLIDHLLQQKALIQRGEQWMVQEDLQDTVGMIPEGLRPLITQRLEALSPEERRALEVASVAGMEYATALAASGLQQNADEVEALYESLANQGHFITTGDLAQWPDGTLSGTYRFQHALYHQVLYEQVGAARRAQLHRRLGERLETGYGERAHEMAAELAVHFEQGHDAGRAVQYLQYAGNHALQRSAHQEAIALLGKGLAMIPSLDGTPESSRQELMLLIALGAALVVTKGYAAPEVAEIYALARDRCRNMDQTLEHSHVLWGLWSFDLVRGHLQTAQELAERYLLLAQHLEDADLVLEAHNMLGQTLSYQGDFTLAYRHTDQGFALYDADHHPALASRYVRDPGVLCLFYKAWNLWFLGYPSQALSTGREALALAEHLAHPFSHVAALYLMAWLHQLRREAEAVQSLAEAVVIRSQELSFALWLEQGAVLHGWALAAQGQMDEGIAEMHQGLTAYLETGAKRAHVSFLLGLVEAYMLSGQTENGHACLNEALAAMDAQSERWCEAELHRLRGELLLQEGLQSQRQHAEAQALINEEAQACFQQALSVAREQQAKMLELRAALSLSRLWQQQGKAEAAHELLLPLYSWFTEGWDTADLQEAKAFLTSEASPPAAPDSTE